ncbi:hypothetical protein F5Y16DRAFT_402964 [Xylariaceae sp. FL0255]|nr:hypothetical protein F5Y16DRAFT_402964 [Xylariaceae sp. FL0255]
MSTINGYSGSGGLKVLTFWSFDNTTFTDADLNHNGILEIVGLPYIWGCDTFFDLYLDIYPPFIMKDLWDPAQLLTNTPRAVTSRDPGPVGGLTTIMAMSSELNSLLSDCGASRLRKKSVRNPNVDSATHRLHFILVACHAAILRALALALAERSHHHEQRDVSQTLHDIVHGHWFILSTTLATVLVFPSIGTTPGLYAAQLFITSVAINVTVGTGSNPAGSKGIQDNEDVLVVSMAMHNDENAPLWAMNTREILPKNPCSIITAASLVADSDMLREDIIPRGSEWHGNRQDVFQGWIFSLE